MRRIILILTLALMSAASLAQVKCLDRTLRLNYVFTGGTSPVAIALHSMSVTDGWYGRCVNMDRVPVRGNGEIILTDDKSSEVIYANSFSTLFQEWLTTDESKSTVKAFENTFLLPMPAAQATVCIRLFDNSNNVACEFTHKVNPEDILIERREKSGAFAQYVHKGAEPGEAIDVAIVAEGYSTAERQTFLKDAQDAVEAILSHQPFGRYAANLNFLAVAPDSGDSGVSVPRDGLWKNSALHSNFDTFYIERYLTTSSIFDLHDILDGLPYEHIIILANTDVYGGGGIYNSYTLTTARHQMFKPVVVHEFGHSFGALADEYDYDSYDDPYYFPDVEPWEQNITTKCDFASKWQDMMDEGVPGAGLHEGAGYQSKGVWRASEDCRMRTNKAPAFCPVCQRAIERMILFNLR